MGFIWTIIVGVIVGTIAKFIMPGKNEPQGFVLTAILGIVGSFLASYAGQAMGWYAQGQSAGWIMSILGAIVVLGVYGMVTKKNA
ncbi:MAG: GlsB/YeaQ/YmgE family stress response membrane protein [Alphaproteobacteria bacterium]|nr:GlsB/YeaQ/YmgE family stress response membrane protein [Alphaproteobacteria bacterium]